MSPMEPKQHGGHRIPYEKLIVDGKLNLDLVTNIAFIQALAEFSKSFFKQPEESTIKTQLSKIKLGDYSDVVLLPSCHICGLYSCSCQNVINILKKNPDLRTKVFNGQ